MQATVDRVGSMLNSRELAIVLAKHRGKAVPDRTLRFWRNELCIRPVDGCLYNREALKTLTRLVYWLKRGGTMQGFKTLLLDEHKAAQTPTTINI
jgi:hypothetical protein